MQNKARIFGSMTTSFMDNNTTESDLRERGQPFEVGFIINIQQGEIVGIRGAAKLSFETYTNKERIVNAALIKFPLPIHRGEAEEKDMLDNNLYIARYYEHGYFSEQARKNLDDIRGGFNIKQAKNWEELQHAIKITGDIKDENNQVISPEQMWSVIYRLFVPSGDPQKLEATDITNKYGLRDKVIELIYCGI
jgi:hypothetical protein